MIRVTQTLILSAVKTNKQKMSQEGQEIILCGFMNGGEQFQRQEMM